MNNKLRIAIVSKADSYGGGASRVAEELAQEFLKDNNLDVTHFVTWSGKGFNALRKPAYGSKAKLIRSLMRKQKRRGYVEYLPFELLGLRENLIHKNYDIVHFHDIAESYSIKSLDWLSTRTKVAWTFHDCSPFTGGCLYPGDCERYKENCGQCPQLGIWPLNTKKDKTPTLLKIKSDILHKGNIHCIAPSHWMADLALASGNLKDRPHVIPNSVDLNIYRPQNKADIREKLGLPQNRLILLYTAGWLGDERKGAKDVAELARRLADYNPLILAVGRFSFEAKKNFKDVDVHFSGLFDNKQDLANHYAACDLACVLSTQDNLPLTVIEAMGTGVPVLGFRTGGIPEMIIDEATGIIVEQHDLDTLEQKLRHALENNLLPQWSQAAYGHAHNNFSPKLLAERHLAFYRSLL